MKHEGLVNGAYQMCVETVRLTMCGCFAWPVLDLLLPTAAHVSDI